MDHSAKTQSAFDIQTVIEGDTVMYGFLGKCFVACQETRMLGDQTVPGLRLVTKKAPQAASIWVPHASALDRGLRLPMNKEQADAALCHIQSKEIYFDVKDPWNKLVPQLDTCIYQQGGNGLAQVISFLTVLKKQYVIPPQAISKYYDTVYKIFLKEMTDAFKEHQKKIDDLIQKGLKNKQLPTNA